LDYTLWWGIRGSKDGKLASLFTWLLGKLFVVLLLKEVESLASLNWILSLELASFIAGCKPSYLLISNGTDK